ncbi:MAG: glycosyltransferase family 2 protein [Pseudomonadota bacterium]
MANPALALDFENRSHRSITLIGQDTALYASLIPIEVAVGTRCVVVDVFDGHAIVATTTDHCETVSDILFKAGFPATFVRCDATTVSQLLSRVYLTTATDLAERDGASSRGVVRWMQHSFTMRLLSIAIPFVALLLLCALLPQIMLGMGSVLLVGIVAFRMWITRRSLTEWQPSKALINDDTLPEISLLVPLYKESEIVPRLLAHLSRLAYPSSKYEVLFLLEAADSQTRAALARTTLPTNMRVLHIPAGTVQTKPRAMNAALPFTSGSIIGVYDAEDAPDPMQLSEVAEAFSRIEGLACVQAPLDIFNTSASVLSGCFAVEYAMLFRIQNPSLAQDDLPIPLGGTSFFIRKDALYRLGAWDAFNVTEDADLGLRLHAGGYKSAMVSRPTFEEAPSDIGAWKRQRSRWLKGFLLTWMTRQGGSMRLFAAAMLLGPVVAATIGLASLPLWFIAASPGGLINGAPLTAFLGLALLSELSLFSIGWRALRERHLRHLRPYLLVMPFYRLLLIPALLKALIEAIRTPAYWDKTQHGIHG